ncbi:MAG: hypothetical protein KHW56_05525 [Clostridiales bacterium]|nr:hypothetical protein [Clostridiales bacterium]
MNKKKLLALVLAALMSVSGLTIAFADGTVPAGSAPAAAMKSSGDAVTVTDAAGLAAALEAGGTVILGSDISMDTRYDISIQKDVVLDLNGYTITKSYGDSNHYLFVIEGGSLTVEESKGNGRIEATDEEYGYGIQLRGSGSSFELRSGTIQTTQETVDIYGAALNSSVKISGGTLISTKDSVLGVRGSGTAVQITGGEMTSGGQRGVYISGFYGGTDSIQFTMTGGKLTHSGGINGAIQLAQNATVTIGGTAEIESTDKAVLVQSNAILNIEGGKLTSSDTDTSSVIRCTDNSTTNISGGTFSGRYGVDTGGTASVNISGGTFDAYTTFFPSILGNPSIQITGGKFKDDISQYFPDQKMPAPEVTVTFSDSDGVLTLTADAFHRLTEAKIASYQWYKNGIMLDGETGTTLTVDGYATYSVVVQAEYKNMTSERTVVYDYREAVPEPPDSEESGDREYGDYYGNEKWDEVKKEIAKLIEDEEFGETIEMSATGLPYFPSSVARALKGYDITLEVRKNGVTYKVNGLEIGSIDKIWYEFEELETELLTETPGDEEDSSKPADENKTNPSTGR